MVKKILRFIGNNSYIPYLLVAIPLAVIHEYVGWKASLVLVALLILLISVIKITFSRNINSLAKAYIRGNPEEKDKILAIIGDDEIIGQVGLRVEKIGGKFEHWI